MYNLTNEISAEELVAALKTVNGTYFHIDDLDAYAQKVLTYGKAAVYRAPNGELASFVLYYDNGPEVFFTMGWTNPVHAGNSLCGKLLTHVINSSPKEARAEVSVDNLLSRKMCKIVKLVPESEKGGLLQMRYSKRLAVMQPYVFPYIGYFHLIEASDKIIFYDDVNFIKGGWINRNRILLNGEPLMVTFPLEGASPNKQIGEIKPLLKADFRNAFLARITAAYKKAPHYQEVTQMLRAFFEKPYENIADLAINSITSVYDYLGMEIRWTKSSVITPETKGMDKADRLIKMAKDLGYKKYVNAMGGQELYDKDYFHAQDIQLNFVQPSKVEYKQFDKEFVPWLSIIDVLMFNDKKAVKEMLSDFEIL